MTARRSSPERKQRGAGEVSVRAAGRCVEERVCVRREGRDVRHNRVRQASSRREGAKEGLGARRANTGAGKTKEMEVDRLDAHKRLLNAESLYDTPHQPQETEGRVCLQAHNDWTNDLHLHNCIPALVTRVMRSQHRSCICISDRRTVNNGTKQSV